MSKVIHILAPFVDRDETKEIYLKLLVNVDNQTIEEVVDLKGNAESGIKLLNDIIINKVNIYDLSEYFSDDNSLDAVIYKLSEIVNDMITKKTNRLELDNVEDYVEEGCKLIDVREVDEYERGYILNAKNIPLSELSNRVDEFNKNEKYVLYCNSSSRSAQAEEFLKSLGYDVYNLDGSYAFYKLYKDKI